MSEKTRLHTDDGAIEVLPFGEPDETGVLDVRDAEITIQLTTAEVDGECNFHDCPDGSTHLWRGVAPEPSENRIHSYVAGYCSTHSEGHAEPNERLHYIGEFEVDDDE